MPSSVFIRISTVIESRLFSVNVRRQLHVSGGADLALQATRRPARGPADDGYRLSMTRTLLLYSTHILLKSVITQHTCTENSA